MRHEFDSCYMHLLKQVVYAYVQNRTANENNRCTARFECRAAGLNGTNAELLSSPQPVQGLGFRVCPTRIQGSSFYVHKRLLAIVETVLRRLCSSVRAGPALRVCGASEACISYFACMH